MELGYLAVPLTSNPPIQDMPFAFAKKEVHHATVQAVGTTRYRGLASLIRLFVDEKTLFLNKKSAHQKDNNNGY